MLDTCLYASLLGAELGSLNLALTHEHAIFRLRYNVKTDCIDIVPASDVWLHELGCIINISREYRQIVERRFANLGYEVTWNNSGSSFWLTSYSSEKA